MGRVDIQPDGQVVYPCNIADLYYFFKLEDSTRIVTCVSSK